jgi:general secretion pathway protein G
MLKVRYAWHSHHPYPAGIPREASLYLQSGFQLVELLIAMAVISVLAIVAIPSYSSYRDKVNNGTAAIDIDTITKAINEFYIDNHYYPDSLADVNLSYLQDPWHHPYRYLRINGASLAGNAALRKDRNLIPINTDYDLYSMGKDGASFPPLTARQSQDDIVRANNGQFIGLAADY